MRYVRKTIALVGTLALATLALLSVGIASGQLQLTPVLSGSMRPAFNPGDALLTLRTPATSLHVGEVPTVNVPGTLGGGERVHRIVSLVRHGNAVVIRTRGDANAVDDPGSLTVTGHVYRMIMVVPFIGWILDFKVWSGERILLGVIILLGILSVATNRNMYRRRRTRIHAAKA